MKRILLVNPNRVTVPYPVAPLGLCIMASVLDRDYDVQVFDGTFSGTEGLRDAILAHSPDYVGLTIRNIDNVLMENSEFYITGIASDFMPVIREATDAPVIVGGAGFTILPEEVLAALDADYGVVGEGEDAMVALLQTLDSGGDPRTVPGVVGRKFGRADGTAGHPFDVEQTPFPRIDKWLDFDPYRARGAYPIQIKRGCVHKCVYCTYPAIEGCVFRQRTVSRVVDEIAETRDRLGDVTFEFVDSTFNDPPGVAEAICREIVDRGMRVPMRTMGVNPRHVTDELLTLMLQAGFQQIDSTPDTASPRVLEGMGKGFTRECLEQTADLFRKHDMPTMWFFVFGGPEETEETIVETFDFIDRFVYEEDLVYIAEGLRIYPQTALYDRAITEGRIAPGQPMLDPVFYLPPTLTEDRLQSLVVEAIETRLNCIRAVDPAPDPALVRAAMRMRERDNLDEPMFRTLLRLRRRFVGMM
ncbi:MAG: radical SAM protein [bacterium]|nr:radical SAM protein [bacterium]